MLLEIFPDDFKVCILGGECFGILPDCLADREQLKREFDKLEHICGETDSSKRLHGRGPRSE